MSKINDIVEVELSHIDLNPIVNLINYSLKGLVADGFDKSYAVELVMSWVDNAEMLVNKHTNGDQKP